MLRPPFYYGNISVCSKVLKHAISFITGLFTTNLGMMIITASDWGAAAKSKILSGSRRGNPMNLAMSTLAAKSEWIMPAV
jgi:hypothetical protein